VSTRPWHNRPMADNQENQETQPDELQPEAEPKVEAGEPPGRREKQNSSRSKKISSSTWITAVISAIAALAGVLIGAFVSYYAAQPQASAQTGTAKSSAPAKGKGINKREREKDYADYLKNEQTLVNTEAALVGILRGSPDDFAALNSAKDKWNKDSVTVARSDFMLSFNDSDKADDIRVEISHQTDAIHKALVKLVNQAYAHEPIDQPGLQDVDTMFTALQRQFDRFTDQAKTDLRWPNGGLPS
jgi:hypothetical protein